MSIWFYILYFIALIILIFIIIKIYLIKNSIREIRKNLNKILNSDTNNLLTISTGDKDIIGLTNDLNIELQKLRKLRLQYENGNQELKKSITNISHDMRTPLTAINGYVELMKESEKNNKQEKYIKIVERKTKDLIELTEQLFDFSKTMDIGMKINKEKCCINEILEETIANYYIIFKEKNIEPQIEITANRIYKIIDRNTIVRVFENILSNIIKYSSGNCKIILNEDGKIIFSNKATSLDATSVKKIFNRYYTVENAKKSTGLGLSIAKQLIELNEGNIVARYEQGYLIIELELEL